MATERSKLVALTANYRHGGLPTDIHHIQTRGAHPELKADLDNLVGISRAEHIARHDHGIEPAPPLDLADIWG